MRSKWMLPLVFSLLSAGARAQNTDTAQLNIGDSAPPLQASHWLRGAPVQSFIPGKLYVVEFWATWCKPCIAGMPHLSELASTYKDNVTIVGVDIYEKKTTLIGKIRTFVDSMGQKMQYNVAVEDSNLMETDWLAAFDAQSEGIPIAFVINTAGRVAWIGHPHSLDQVLPKIIDGTWNIESALADRRERKRIADLDKDASFELARYYEDPSTMKPNDFAKPDSALKMIGLLVQKEPELRYSTFIAAYTFCSLLKTSPHEAYLYGQHLLSKSSAETSLGYIIYKNVRDYSRIINLPEEIYRQAITAYQMDIGYYPETIDIPKAYHTIAKWYWQLKDTANAIHAERQALFQSNLQQYKSN